MKDKFQIGQGLGHQLEMAFARHGWTQEQVNELTKGDTLGEFLDVIGGNADILRHDGSIHIVDCDRVPTLGDWLIAEHRKIGILRLQRDKLGLISPVGPWEKRGITLNATAGLYLLEHQSMIPSEWKRHDSICFAGTDFRGKGESFTRNLHIYRGRCMWQLDIRTSLADAGYPIAIYVV